MKKINFIMSVVTFIFLLFSSISFAGVADLISVTDLTGSALLPESNTNLIIGTMLWIAFVIGIGMLIFIGIKYVISGVEGKAKMKETIIPWVIGAVIVAGAITITAAAFDAFDVN